MKPIAFGLLSLVGLIAPASAGHAQPKPAHDGKDVALPAGAVARLGDARMLHGEEFVGLSLSPDGSLVLGADEKRICLWDTETGRLIREFKGIAESVRGAALSPDGKLVAATGRESPVLVWDAVTGKVVHRLERNGGWAGGVCWSPDSQWIAFDAGGVVMVHSAQSGKLLHTFKAGGESTCVAISRDRKRLLSGGWHSAHYVWDTETGKELCTLVGARAHSPIHFTPDGKSVIGRHYEEREGTSHASLRVWDADTGKKLYDVEEASRLVGFLPDGAGVLVTFDGTIRLWDMTLRKTVPKWKCADASLTALSGDGEWIAGVSDGRISSWNLATGKERCLRTGHTSGVTAVSFSPDGKTAVSYARSSALVVWDWPTGRDLRQQPLNFKTGPLKLTHLSDGKVMLIRHWTTADLGWLWDPETGHTKTHHKGDVYAEELAVGDDGKRIYTCGSRTGSVGVWDLTKGQELRQINTTVKPVGKDQDRQIRSASLSPDGRRLAWTASEIHPEKGQHNDGGVIDVDTGRRVAAFKVDELSEDLEQIAYSPDGTTLATCGESGSLRFWHPETGKQLAERPEVPGRVLAFSPDGRFVAVARTEIAVWDVAARKELVRFSGHLNTVNALAFEPLGRVLVSASSDGTLLVWDLTGQLKNGKLPKQKLSEEELVAAWGNLKSNDPKRAQQAVVALACAAPDAVAFIAKRLESVPVTPAESIRAMIADLSEADFLIHEQAERDLAALGEVAEPALRAATQSENSAVRKRAFALLRPLDKGELSADQARSVRAVAVLEYAGGADARRLLARLAAGDPSGRVTRQATSALARLLRCEAVR